MNETRNITTLFNTLYKQAIDAINDDNIQWLDFYDTLFETKPRDSNTMLPGSIMGNAIGNDSQLCLKEKYLHDGTHLHPCYTELIEQAMNRK